MNLLAIAGFIVLWIVTFVPAWKSLARLLALSVAKKPKGLDFLATFLFYRFLILLPYLWLLIFGHNLPPILKGLIISVVAIGAIFSVVRFFFRQQAIDYLWGVYSFVYDGLLQFYPYQNLLELVTARLNKSDSLILDAGCGTGNLIKKVRSSNPQSEVVAIDSSVSMVRRARAKLKDDNKVIFKTQEINLFLEKSNQKFDAILLVNVLYAVDNTDNLWQLCLSHLHKGGRLIVTNSDRGGSWPIIKEHLSHSSFIKLLHPKLLGVFFIDLYISQLAATGSFKFVGLEELKKQVAVAGGSIDQVKRCYGGPKDGVNLLFTVTKAP